jgi:hypothetical protein
MKTRVRRITGSANPREVRQNVVKGAVGECIAQSADWIASARHH